MFIGTCNCDPRTLSTSRRGLLCTGGAGFVTALIGTLAGSSRTAQAQELASKPPEVDSVAVRIVTDNQIIKWIPTEKRYPTHSGTLTAGLLASFPRRSFTAAS
jgi:7,8-dihydropterin-6-yl-methyl-4-(beta-D-ribofuranosyl)aminobenzene 5'-phosphate synthase